MGTTIIIQNQDEYDACLDFLLKCNQYENLTMKPVIDALWIAVNAFEPKYYPLPEYD